MPAVGGGAAGAAGTSRRGYLALLVALGVDNLGSGLFLPLSLVFVVQAVGLPVAVAGVVVAVGTLVGLAVPPLAGRLVDRVGPRVVVVASRLLQAAGLLAYLAADGVPGATVAAVLVAAGTQLFYSSLFALIADVAPPGPRDHPFAVVDMVRSAAFGAGALLAGALLAVVGEQGLRLAVALDAVSSVLAGLLLSALVRPRPTEGDQDGHEREDQRPGRPVGGVLRDRPFLVLILVTGLVALPTDLFLVGLPVFALEQLSAPGWVPGACVALLTVVAATSAAAVVRATARLSRTRVVGAGAVVGLLWCAAAAAATAVPRGWVPWWLLASTAVLAASGLLIGTRPNAVAEAAAPPGRRGRYLAGFQYAFTGAGVAAPLVVSLFALHPLLPWATAAAATAGGLALLPWLSRHLPAHAVHPTGHPSRAGRGAALHEPS